MGGLSGAYIGRFSFDDEDDRIYLDVEVEICAPGECGIYPVGARISMDNLLPGAYGSGAHLVFNYYAEGLGDEWGAVPISRDGNVRKTAASEPRGVTGLPLCETGVPAAQAGEFMVADDCYLAVDRALGPSTTTVCGDGSDGCSGSQTHALALWLTGVVLLLARRPQPSSSALRRGRLRGSRHE